MIKQALVTILFFAFILAAIAIGSPSEKDIQTCMDNSNYSYETCVFKLK